MNEYCGVKKTRAEGKGNTMLTLEHISYTVDGKRILDDISFSVDERFVAVTGPNGGGKSTLAKVVMGIVTPDTGRILLDGEDITGLSITERARRGVSFAFQQPVRFKGVTVKDLISLLCSKIRPLVSDNPRA